MNTVEELMEAINDRKSISFQYMHEGNEAGMRMGNPHAVYVDEKSHETLVDIYQERGTTDMNQILPSWETFEVQSVKHLKMLQPHFEVNEGYRSDSIKYKTTLCKI